MLEKNHKTRDDSEAALRKEVIDAAVPRDTSHVSGWDYIDAAQTGLQLYGGACDAARAGGAVSIVFVCLLI